MIDKLKKMKITAMKEKNAETKSILSVLQSDAQLLAKSDGNRDLQESDIIKSAKTLINRNNKAIVDIENGGKDADHLKREILILEQFLPEMMSESEVHSIIDSLVSELSEDQRNKSSMGKIMGKLKSHGDAIDMKVASKYLAQKLS